MSVPLGNSRNDVFIIGSLFTWRYCVQKITYTVTRDYNWLTSTSLGRGAKNGRGGGGRGRSFIVFVFLRTPFSHSSIPNKGKSSKNPKNLQILTLGYLLVFMINWIEPTCASWDNFWKTEKKEKTEWSFNLSTLKNDQQVISPNNINKFSDRKVMRNWTSTSEKCLI